MLELYLIRHGIAAERGTYANDADRPLTEPGIKKTQQIAQRLRSLGVQFDLILTSPLVRAHQTAEILQKENLAPKLQISNDLAPEGDFKAWLNWLQEWRKNGGSQLAIVGHEPDLGEWAESLVWGEIRHQLIVKKAGVIGLLLPERGSPVGQSQMFWLSPPKFLL
jgi:phosphohistidine phosphatase